MDFSRRKLPLEAAENLKQMPVRSVQPFALISVPVYVFMKRNGKFVSVKSPLDFFTPEELDKFAPFENFFFEQFANQVSWFLDAGARIRTILSWTPEGRELPPPYYELSDAVLRVLATLWSPQVSIEPYFASAFAEALCGPLSGELLRPVRETDVVRYERAVLVTGWMVFLAAHLGMVNLDYLTRLRESVFRQECGIGPWEEMVPGQFIRELRELAALNLGKADGKEFFAEQFFTLDHALAQKIRTRVDRMRTELQGSLTMQASIFGPGGFVDA